MSLYSNDGYINTTTVDGTSFTGIYAVDGSINVILDDSSNTGVYHPCGAIRINSSGGNSYYDPSGAVYYNHLLGPGMAPS